MNLYLDTANLGNIAEFSPRVAGFTTNPSLMKQSGTHDYKAFALEVLSLVAGKPVSFEVFSDDIEGMALQARVISGWGDNCYVKIPVTNTKGESCAPLMRRLAEAGVKVNATAICAMEQIETVARSLTDTPAIISIFAGRIADTGRDPTPFITKAIHVKQRNTQILWASTREVLNVKQAEQAGADIITMSPSLILKMLEMKEIDLNLLSIMTVKQFHNDAAGLSL